MKKLNKKCHWMGSVAGSALVLASVVFAGQAVGQTAQDTSVLDRPRLDYDPVGIDLFVSENDPGAPFVLYPSLTIQGLYDDNVYRTQSNEEGDFFTRISPQLILVSDWENHAMSLGARADIGRYEEFDDNDYSDFIVFGDGLVDVTEITSLFASGEFGLSHYGRDNTSDVPGDSTLTSFYKNAQTVGIQTQPSDWTFRISGSRTEFDYLDTDYNQDDRDYTRWNADVRIGYGFQPGVSVFVRGGYNWRIYDDPTDDFGYERDSKGWNVEGGLSYEISSVLSFDLGAGYQFQNYADPDFGEFGGYALNGEITWNATDFITVRAGASTGFDEVALNGLAGSKTVEGHVGVDYEILENLIWSNDVQYSVANYDATAPGAVRRHDKIWNAGSNLTWKLNEFFEMSGSYSYSTRDSNISGEDFDDNTFMLSLKAQL